MGSSGSQPKLCAFNCYHQIQIQRLVKCGTTYFSFFPSNAVNCKSALDVIDQTEKFASFLNSNDIYKKFLMQKKSKKILNASTHETCRVVGICPDFPVDFNQSLHDDFRHF
jgi:hypothetical protein